MQFLTIMCGILVLLGLACLLSENWRAINYRTVLGALGIQITIAALVLYFPAGQAVLVSIAGSVSGVIDYSAQGIQFMFGDIGRFEMGFIFAVHVLPVMIFFSSLVSVLYYLGVLQKIVGFIGSGLEKLLKTSPAESMAATSNIFIGNTDVFILMRPYAPHMTKSELFALMTGGLASVAGAVLVGYASMGVKMEYLLAAAFMSAPGGLLMAKIIYPETEELIPISDDFVDEDPPVNVVEAATKGAASGLGLALNVGAMLLALISLIAMIDGILGWAAGLLGFEGVSLELMFSYLFAPFAFLLGVPTDEMLTAGSLIGQKVILNEFIAYVSYMDVKETLSEHSQLVISIALAGFANLSAPAALIGVLGAIVPEKKHFIAKMGGKVILGGLLSNLMSAALAALFFTLKNSVV